MIEQLQLSTSNVSRITDNSEVRQLNVSREQVLAVLMAAEDLSQRLAVAGVLEWTA